MDAPAGWYADPTDPTSLRYWSGSAWEHPRTAPRRWRTRLFVAALVLLYLGGLVAANVLYIWVRSTDGTSEVARVTSIDDEQICVLRISRPDDERTHCMSNSVEQGRTLTLEPGDCVSVVFPHGTTLVGTCPGE